MGWPELMVAVEYDGDQHPPDRRQYVRDVRRLEQLNRLGWIVVRVVKEDSPRQVVRRVREAVAFRQSRLNGGRDFGPNRAHTSASAHVSAV
jgi:very-short-patch-repair endonuclease